MYKMRTDSDCGPACLAEATGLPYETVMSKWPGGWRGGDRGKLGAPNDTPLDHFQFLSAIGLPFRIVVCGEIIRGEAPAGKTVVLVHSPSNLLAQHWTVLAPCLPGMVSLHWGDGAIHTFKAASFEKSYSSGWPACAYEVGRGQYRVTWWQRLIAKITGKWL